MVYPPDLMVFDPNKKLLGRLLYDAQAAETISFLRTILQENPHLKPEGIDFPDVYANDAEFALLRQRFDNGERIELTTPLLDWLADKDQTYSDDDAIARNLLGACLYHMKLWEDAEKVWQQALKKYPDHPIQHRISYNCLSPLTYPTPVLSDIQGATNEPIHASMVEVPNPQVRAKNIEDVENNKDLLDLGIGVPFVKIPAGTFQMGGTPVAYFPRELPVRTVTISRPFYMSIWMVTRQMFKQWKPQRWPDTQATGLAGWLPADQISFVEATAFCEALSEKLNRVIRLPTEAEWEYAARGGLKNAIYPWGDQPPNAESCNFIRRIPVPVASYPPNGFGLFEMVGNVQEWCSDHFRNDAYQLTPLEVTDPQGPEPLDNYRDRVIRGGWSGTSFCQGTTRNSWRLGYHDRFTDVRIGLRLVCEIPPASDDANV